MARKRHPTNLGMVVAMLVASVLVHLVLWPVGDKVMKMGWGSPPIPVSTGVFEVSLIPADPAAPQDEPDPVHDPEHMVDPSGKLVQLDEVQDERPPEDTDLVAEFDSRTDSPHKAPNIRRPPQPGESAQPNRPGEPSDAKTPSDQPPDKAVKPLALGRPNDEAGGQPIDEGTDGAATRGETPRPPVAGLSPRLGASGSWARDTFGGPSSIDDVDDAEEGAGSVLNTKRWKFASFFNRVRNQIDEQWEPQQVHKAHDPDGHAFGTKTRRTQLIIKLNPDGSLKKIRLERASGAPHLDEEAIRATRAAAPFVNPPPELVDPVTGFIEFRFGFIFEFDGSRRIFRYKR